MTIMNEKNKKRALLPYSFTFVPDCCIIICLCSVFVKRYKYMKYISNLKEEII